VGIATDFVLVIVAGLLGGIFARILRLPLLVGYVIAGVFVGPHTAGPTVVQIHDIELLAEIGVALLLFSLGLEISFRDLQPVRRVALLGGSLEIVLVCVLGAIGATYGLQLHPAESMWFGAMISVSSTMVVVKILTAAGVTSTLASRVMIGLLVVQDFAVVPMLIILPQLSNPEGTLLKLLRSFAAAGAALVIVFVFGTRLLPHILKRVLAWGSRELFLVTVVAIGIGVGYAAYLAGLSLALGAFIAGIILNESEFSHQALSDVAPLRDIFGLLFFVSVGMLFDPAFVFAHVLQVCVVVAVIVIGKAIVIGLITRVFGYRNTAPWIVGLGLSQIGEFSFVLARVGLTGGFLSKSTYDLILTSTIATMGLSPIISAMALPLGRRWPARRESIGTPQAEQTGTLAGHVIVGGYGRSGKAVVRALLEAKIDMVVIELDHAVLGETNKIGVRQLWGDVSTEEILRAAHVDHARMLLLTMPDANTVRIAVDRALAINPRLTVIARAAQERHVRELRNLGVVAAVQPEYEAGMEMVRQALVRSSYDETAREAILKGLRNEFYESG